ncbi:endonuclease NucS domain-containing protein, partial [Vibrio parahaemolyticus]
FFGGFVAAIYDKPVRALMWDMVSDLQLEKGSRITKAEVHAWFEEKYPKIKLGTINAHLIRLSTNATSRHHYAVKAKEDDLFYQLDKSTYRLYDSENDPSPLGTENYSQNEDNEDISEIESEFAEFAYEKDLQNFLSKNLSLIESGLTLYQEDGITGIEYPVGGRYIDILALDKGNNFVVIELKVSKGYDRVVGQLLRYVSWIRKYQAEESQNVRGIIIARNISEDLQLACEGMSNIELLEYELSISLNKVK